MTEARTLDPQRCRVGGLNKNYVSSAGTACHVQVEDYGPIVDRATEEYVRRVNLIVYANYGSPEARIVFGRDSDYPDVRTLEYNAVIQEQMNQLLVQAQATVEEMEQRELVLIRTSLGNRRQASDDELRAEFKECATLYPALFKRALTELRAYQARQGTLPAATAPAPAPQAAAPEAEAPPAPEPVPEPVASPGVPASETVYPLDPETRRRVIEIEGLIVKLGQDFMRLKAYGLADDILLQRCKKLVDQARDEISRRRGGEMQSRLLDMTLDNLAKMWRQVRSQLHNYDRTKGKA
jgi:hypothetical protein